MKPATNPIIVKAQPSVLKCIDKLLRPGMRLISGAPTEEPQSTHRWNYQYLSSAEIAKIDTTQLLDAPVDTCAEKLFRYLIPTHHLAFLRGWKNYIVLSPAQPQALWYIGWLRADSRAVSQIKLFTPVRMLIGPSPVQFFALNARGEQILLTQVGEGRIGDKGQYHLLPLL